MRAIYLFISIIYYKSVIYFYDENIAQIHSLKSCNFIYYFISPMSLGLAKMSGPLGFSILFMYFFPFILFKYVYMEFYRGWWGTWQCPTRQIWDFRNHQPLITKLLRPNYPSLNYKGTTRILVVTASCHPFPQP